MSKLTKTEEKVRYTLSDLTRGEVALIRELFNLLKGSVEVEGEMVDTWGVYNTLQDLGESPEMEVTFL